MKVYVTYLNLSDSLDVEIKTELSRERIWYANYEANLVDVHNETVRKSVDKFIHPLFPKKDFWKVVYQTRDKFIEFSSLDELESFLKKSKGLFLGFETIYSEVVCMDRIHYFESVIDSGRFEFSWGE